MTEPTKLSVELAVLAEAFARAQAYRAASSDRPVAPVASHLARLEALDQVLPERPRPVGEVVAMLDEIGSPATVVSTAGRYFGFVNGGTDPAGAAAALLAGAWDQNVALPVMSPAAARIDAIAADWVCRLLDLPASALAAFCSGASVANLICVVTGRDALLRRSGWNVTADGLIGAPPLRVVTGREMHVSLLKALRVAGIGEGSIEYVATDHLGRISPTDFPTVDDRTLVLLQAGNVNTGHSDPFDELIPAVHDRGGWVHVDGAFGLWAAAAPTRRHLVAGVERADSWATDAHKYLNAPYDAGLAICANPDDLRSAMAIDAAYVATDAARAPMHLGLQMSQRARAVETWAIIATHGREGIAELVETACAHAQYFASLLAAAGATVLAPVVLNQALISFGDDAVTDAVIAATQADGTCWVGGTAWQGRRAMRLSVSDRATTRKDVEAAAAAIIRCWRRVSS